MIKKVDVPLTGGVNTFKDAAAIADNQLASSTNFTSRVNEYPGIRPSMTFSQEVIPDYRPWNSDRSDAFSTSELYHQWARDWRPMRFMFSEFGGDLVGVFQAGQARQVIHQDAGVSTASTCGEGEAVLWMMPGLYAGGDINGGPYCFKLGGCTRTPSLFLFSGIIYAFCGGNSGGHIKPSSGAVLGWDYFSNQWTTSQSSGFEPDGAAVIRDRVLYYKGSTIFWSDKGAPLTIFQDALATGGIIVTGEEQESITAAAEISTSAEGSPVQSTAAVWTKTRMFLLLGEPLQTIDDASETPITGSMQINRLNIEAGCVSQATVTRTPYGTFWVGLDDVWFMPFGQLPMRVGTNIRDVIRAQPPGLQYRLCADYENGYLRIALFAPGSGPTATSPLSHQWMLDLNDGPPQNADSAKWWGPQILNNQDAPNFGVTEASPISGTWAFARDTRATGDGALYSMQNYVMPGDNGAHYIHGMSLATWSQYSGRDTGAPRRDKYFWQATTLYQIGDEIVPPPSTTDFRAPTWVCTTAGITGGSEPNWLASTAASITDGTAVWKPVYYLASGGGTVLSSYKPDSHTRNEIEWELRSKRYTGDDATVEKLLDGAEIAYQMTQMSQITYSTHPDQSSRSRTLGQYGSTLDVLTNQAAASTAWRRKLLSADPTQRFAAQEAQALLHGDAGFVIATGFNDKLKLTLGGVAKVITLAAGYYADLLALWSAIRLACVAQHSITLLSTSDEDYSSIIRARFGIKDQNGSLTVALTEYTPLAAYLGFTTDQAGTSAAAGVYLYGNWSPVQRLVNDFKLPQLRLRFGIFGRGPT